MSVRERSSSVHTLSEECGQNQEKESSATTSGKSESGLDHIKKVLNKEKSGQPNSSQVRFVFFR